MNTVSLLTAYATPYKYGKAVLEGSGVQGAFDSLAVDVPFVFQHQGRYFMLYTGFDGTGYQSALAVSDDLLNWKHHGMVLKRLDKKDKWDGISIAGTWILRDMDIRGNYGLEKFQGKYWMIYHSYPGAGYETGAAEMGFAWTEDENLLDWHRLEDPVYSWRDGADWEKAGLYKACFFRHQDLFYLFYNAKNKESGWIEQTGLATSKDLLHWERYEGNPVLKVEDGTWRSRFVSDPNICRDGDLWLNFFFGYDYKHAQDGIACSRDLFHWEMAEEPILKYGAEGEIDSIHAHKAAIITKGKRLYHFYNAVRPWRPGDRTKNGNEYRVISVASSEPF
ncbi:MAG: hypothetical protein LBD96_08080 [Treponema sp.]|jgi:predicted GH43/DUF377 family glycosyl hydrolase|nr:hypothetical protein [Treponema sp.]